MKITRFALAVRWGRRAVKGSLAEVARCSALPSSARMPASATEAKPPAAWRNSSRRETAGWKCMAEPASLDKEEFIAGEQAPSQRGPGESVCLFGINARHLQSAATLLANLRDSLHRG